ncbi:hypothetical protein [Streptomyces sp. NPDC002537]
MRTGHTYTRHFDLETRQHELLGVDLGEGPPRRLLITGFVFYVVWTGAFLLVFGWPSRVFFVFYFVPPALIAYYGAQRSKRIDRRWNLTHWALTVRYLVVGHRPVVNGGRRAAGRAEWLPLRARLGEKAGRLAELPGMGSVEGLLGDGEAKAVAGRALTLDIRPRLYGPDVVYRARQRGRARK